MGIKAFTLVELAIVLVIIGLLVGGVLAGQELIKISRYTKQIGDWEEIKRAYATYVAKYNAQPGDDGRAVTWLGNGTYNGNNDKILGGLVQKHYYGYRDSNANAETCLFFHHLQKADLYNKLNIPDGTAGCGQNVLGSVVVPVFGTSAPSLMDDPTAGWIVNNEAASASGNSVPGEKIICTVSGGAAYISTSPSFPTLKPEQASYFDSKLDDGIPSVGRVRTLTNSGHTSCSIKHLTLSSAGNCLSSATAYNLAFTDKACNIGIMAGF